MSCSGKCCAAFTLGAGPDRLRSGGIVDGDLIAFMARPLSDEEARERCERFGLAPPTPGYVYHRCIYWDEETRLCTAYANRPTMCRHYPYGRACEHGCDCRGSAEETPGSSPLRAGTGEGGRPEN